MKFYAQNSFAISVTAFVTIVSLSSFALGNGGVSNGAVSGGGGGTLPANPVSIFDIERIIKDSKQDLRLHIKKLQSFVTPRLASSAETKVFLGAKTLFEVLEETGVEIRYYESCRDAQGNEVDGSIYAKEQSDICISAQRIAPKLIAERARTETLALIIHELSHKLGTTEDEAVELQQASAYYLGKTDEKTTWMFPQQASTKALALFDSINQLKEALEQRRSGDIGMLTKKLVTLQDSLRSAVTFRSDPFSFYNTSETQWFEFIMNRITIVASYTADKVEYEKVFAGGTTTTYLDFVRRRGWFQDVGVYGGEIFTKFKSDQDAIDELKRFLFIFERERTYYFNFANNLAIPEHQSSPRKLTSNAFKQFIGTYSVGVPKCTATAAINLPKLPSSIIISEIRPGTVELNLERRWKNLGATATNVLGYDASLMSTGGSIGTMTGSEIPGVEYAQIFSEFATRWAPVWLQSTFRVEKSATGLRYIEEGHQRWTETRTGIVESSYRCEAGLTP